MTERVNIWGNAGCTLPNGKYCHSCCVLPDIEFGGVYCSVAKPANSPCPNLDEEGNGCKLHFKSKPQACHDWHCGTTNRSHKLDLVAQALSLSLVSSDEAVQAAVKIQEEFNVNSKEEDLREIIIEKANILSAITCRKELRIGDLDET